jgi:hypothetical protein
VIKCSAWGRLQKLAPPRTGAVKEFHWMVDSLKCHPPPQFNGSAKPSFPHQHSLSMKLETQTLDCHCSLISSTIKSTNSDCTCKYTHTHTHTHTHTNIRDAGYSTTLCGELSTCNIWCTSNTLLGTMHHITLHLTSLHSTLSGHGASSFSCPQSSPQLCVPDYSKQLLWIYLCPLNAPCLVGKPCEDCSLKSILLGTYLILISSLNFTILLLSQAPWHIRLFTP